MTDGPVRSHWTDYARNWSSLGQPLCPHREDVDIVARAAAARAVGGAALSALMLGVTPELVGGSWPPRTRLVAVDKSMPLIGALWPAPGAPADRAVICADWRAMPVASATVDFVAGDGCNPALDFPGSYRAVFAEVRRVMRPGGRFVPRIFVRRAPAERLDDIRDAVAAGRVATAHELKWRVLNAVHGPTLDGARLGDVCEAWHRLFPEPRLLSERFADRPGWRLDEVLTVDHYRGLDTRYHLATLDEVRALFADLFVELDCVTGGYGMAELCPTLILTPR